MKIKKIIIIFILIIFLTMFIYSLFNIISYINDNKENKKIQEELSKSILVVNNDLKTEVDNNMLEYKIDFESLKEQNSDTVAYLKVNNTEINYIVVKGKDNSYYLNHNFNKKYNISGWIFADYHNKFDETDKNIVIYGHNTKDGSMFGSLKNILNKDWYENEDNSLVVLVTENNIYYYEVFSIYTTEIEDYYINTIFNEKEYEEFVNKIKSRSIYNYNIDVTSNDKILTLSTCSSNGKKRLVLHAKLKDKFY